MKRMSWIARRVAGVTAAMLLVGLGYVGWVLGAVAAAYTAKVLCSCVFVAERDPEACRREDLGAYRRVTAVVDRESRAVTATAFLVRQARADFRPGLGCTLR